MLPFSWDLPTPHKKTELCGFVCGCLGNLYVVELSKERGRTELTPGPGVGLPLITPIVLLTDLATESPLLSSMPTCAASLSNNAEGPEADSASTFPAPWRIRDKSRYFSFEIIELPVECCESGCSAAAL